MLHKALGDNLGHDLVSVVDALAALKAKGKGERRGEIVGGSERERVGRVCHRRTIATTSERSKNAARIATRPPSRFSRLDSTGRALGGVGAYRSPTIRRNSSIGSGTFLPKSASQPR